MENATQIPAYVLHYYEPAIRRGMYRRARHPVSSVKEAIAWMNAAPSERFTPASVMTRGWNPEVVAILAPSHE